MREDLFYDEGDEWLHARSNNWIYIGADINQKDFSKIGKTTVGLNTRHTSSQCPGYFIYTAYNIITDDVHAIEASLLSYLESMPTNIRATHFSTPNKTECFWTNPNTMAYLVEEFITDNYGLSVTYENVHFSGVSRYQCPHEIYNLYDLKNTTAWINDPSAMPVTSLNISGDQYRTGNQVEYETDLGDGLYLDHDTGLERYRDPHDSY